MDARRMFDSAGERIMRPLTLRLPDSPRERAHEFALQEHASLHLFIALATRKIRFDQSPSKTAKFQFAYGTLWHRFRSLKILSQPTFIRVLRWADTSMVHKLPRPFSAPSQTAERNQRGEKGRLRPFVIARREATWQSVSLLDN
jgi:hypothetical protein